VRRGIVHGRIPIRGKPTSALLAVAVISRLASASLGLELLPRVLVASSQLRPRGGLLSAGAPIGLDLRAGLVELPSSVVVSHVPLLALSVLLQHGVKSV
jgi:hypothetical protein